MEGDIAPLPPWPQPVSPFPLLASFCTTGTHTHVCGHSASHLSSIFMPCKQWPLATVSVPSGLGCTLNGITCPGENRPMGEACMSWERVGDHPGKGLQSRRYRECCLDRDAQALPLALLTPHPTGRRMARGGPQVEPLKAPS